MNHFVPANALPPPIFPPPYNSLCQQNAPYVSSQYIPPYVSSQYIPPYVSSQYIPPYDPTSRRNNYLPFVSPLPNFRDESFVRRGDIIPNDFLRSPSGILLGTNNGRIAIRPPGYEGSFAIFGGSGTGKSTLINAMLFMWCLGVVAVDLDGYAMDFYKIISSRGNRRPYKFFNLMSNRETIYHYDFFKMIREAPEEKQSQLLRALAIAIVPLPYNAGESKYWYDSAQNILTAGLIHYFIIRAEFIDALIAIATNGFEILVKNVKKHTLSKIYMSQFNSIEDVSDNDMANSAFAELCVHLNSIIGDVKTVELFTPAQNPSPFNTISWQDIETHNIFINVSENELEQKSAALRLILTMFGKHIESRPEKFSMQGQSQTEILFICDELPKYGRLQIIEEGIVGWRKRKVSSAIFCQSLAQLDMHYGELGRRTMLGSCGYQILLGSSDQIDLEYFSETLGEIPVVKQSVSTNYNCNFPNTIQHNEIFEPIFRPAELKNLGNKLLLIHPLSPHPYNFCILDKIQLNLSSVDSLLKQKDANDMLNVINNSIYL